MPISKIEGWNMKIGKIIVLCLALFLITHASNAAISFYKGSAVVSSFKANVDITDKAEIKMHYVLSGKDNVSLEFINVPASAKITVNGKAYNRSIKIAIDNEVPITVEYTTNTGSGAAKQLSIDPNILFNGNFNSNKIGSYNVEIKMPSGVKELLSSSENPSFVQTIDGRKQLSWGKLNSYATSLTINWHEFDYDIDVQRIINVLEDTFIVKNVVKNKGRQVSNVKLVQSFLAGDFEAIEPLNEFETITAGNDVRLEWRKEISIIPANSTVEFEYKLKATERGENVVFRPLHLLVDNNLIKIIQRVEYTGGAKPLNLSEEIELFSKKSRVENQTSMSAEEVARAFEQQRIAREELVEPEQPEEMPNALEDSAQKEKAKAQEILGIKKTVSWIILFIMMMLILVLVIRYILKRRGEF